MVISFESNVELVVEVVVICKIIVDFITYNEIITFNIISGNNSMFTD